MSNFRHSKYLLTFIFFYSSLSVGHEDAIVEHHDRINIVESLTLSKVIDLTLEKFPEQQLNSALKQQAEALQQRGNSWLAGAPSIAMRYQDDLPGDNIGFREIETELELPLWNWGQRSAGQAVAEQTHEAATKQSELLKLEVAGLVRRSLWDISLHSLHYQHAKSILEISEQLLSKIKRRVELGDLPRSDLLLAKSDHLQKRSLLVQAEAEMLHSRKTYISLTQMSDIPASYTEQQSPISEIKQNHPQLLAINSQVKRKQAELQWVKSAGSGQTNLILGGKSERGDRNDQDIESMSVEVSIPFGGSAHLAPDIAEANLELTEALAERARIFRNLERLHHEAKHALEVSQVELKIANELKQIAESHLKMTQLSFSAGEINLLDLLKIQAQSFDALRHANEQEVMLKRNIAQYNQVVGVLP